MSQMTLIAYKTLIKPLPPKNDIFRSLVVNEFIKRTFTLLVAFSLCHPIPLLYRYSTYLTKVNLS